MTMPKKGSRKIFAQAIEIALGKGWQPEQKGSTFELILNLEEHNF